MKIAVDAMGGDYAPGEVVRGALEAADEGIEIILVGDCNSIRRELGRENTGRVSVVHASEVIGMDEQPVAAVRKKRDSSIVKSVGMVKEGLADAFVSAGSTGAVMAASMFGLGRISGIERPAIAAVLPSEKGCFVLLDVGANVDCRPRNLLQFGLMGSLFAERILGIRNPRVGLLNIGEEEVKGNELTLAAFPLLRDAGINFAGNVDGRSAFGGLTDVVVCDGFAGNVVLKFCEGMSLSLMHMIKIELTQNWLAKMGLPLTFPVLKEIKRKTDYTEYGGAPLLGVNGVVMVCHGSSKYNAVKNAVKAAAKMVSSGLIGEISGNIDSGRDRKVECSSV